jgi:putative nucleotidyltransferase with HDIG domain
MSEISLQNAQRIATLLSGAVKGVAFYPVGHPAVMNPVQEIASLAHEVLQFQPEIRLGVMDGSFFLEEHLFTIPTTPVRELADCFAGKEISTVTICRGVQREELALFVSLLARKSLTASALGKILEQKKVYSIRLDSTAGTEEKEGHEKNASEAVETYGRALEAVRSVFSEIENGRIPNSGKIIAVVKNLVTLTIHDPLTLVGLAMIKDYDNYTFNHCVNVGVISMALSASLEIDRKGMEEAGIAGFLHDIGKTRIEKCILNKPGRLSAAELEQMKKHPEYGAKIISEMEGISSQVQQAVLGHHIRHNRQGYPEWARGLPFDTLSEIIAVADCYDAITTLRVYRSPLSPKAALDEIRKLAGSQLDGAMVTRFMEMMGKYPVGTLVRLDNNEIAVVFKPNPADSEAPVVKVIMDSRGETLGTPREQRLGDGKGTRYATIVAVIDPFLKDIDVARYFR